MLVMFLNVLKILPRYHVWQDHLPPATCFAEPRWRHGGANGAGVEQIKLKQLIHSHDAAVRV